MSAKRILVPPSLSRGDLVGIVAPGFAARRRQVATGLAELRSMGLRVRVGPSVRARVGYLAGSDDLRARDLVSFIEDDEIRAILFARGGYGTSRLLDRIPWRTLSKRPKIILGYSDFTAVSAPALDRSRLSTVYGPVLVELADPRRYDRASFERALFRSAEPLELRFPKRGIVCAGTADGRLAGGCLTLLAHLAGTPYEPSLRGKVLLLEEIEEAPFRIDRMLTQMKLAGMLDGVAGVLVGSLTRCTPRPGSGPSPSAVEVVGSFFDRERIPVVAGLPIGHCEGKVSVPLGFRARVDTGKRRVLFEP